MFGSPTNAFERSFMREFGDGEEDESRKRRKSMIGRAKLLFESADTEHTATLDFMRPPAPKFNRHEGLVSRPGSSQSVSGEDHKALLESRVENAKLLPELNRLKRELAETKFELDRKKNELENNKMDHDRKISETKHRLRRAQEQETAASAQLQESNRNWKEESEQLTHQMAQVQEENALLREQLAELDAEKNEDKSLTCEELMEQRRTVAELQTDLEETNAQLEQMTDANTRLTEEINTLKQNQCELERRNGDLEQQVSDYQNENDLANALREELHKMKNLELQNESLRKKCEYYRANSENTALLKEHNKTLEDKLNYLNKCNDALTNENNELKSLMAQASREQGREHCLPTLDTLAAQLTTAHSKLETRETTINALNVRVSNSECVIDSLNSRISSLSNQIEELRNQAKGRESELTEKCEYLTSTLEEERRDFTEQINKLTIELENSTALLQDKDSQLENYAKYEEELENLRHELEVKERTVEELNQHLRAKGDFDPDQTRVLHMEFNPLQEAHEEYSNQLENATTENARLKIRVEELEKEREKIMEESMNVTERVNLRVAESSLQTEIEGLQQRIQQLEKEKVKSKEIQGQLVRNYRETCMMLTGYQFKMKDQSHYEIQSVFEPQEGKHFLFRKGGDGRLSLLDTDFALEWRDFMQTYLGEDDSIPAFLAAVTLQLYARERDQTTMIACQNDETNDETIQAATSSSD